MLGRLIKHEWKNTCGMGGLLLGAMALITIIGWLAFQTPMWKSASSGRGSFGWLDVFGILTLVMYVILLAVVNYGILIYMGVNFYRTMYSDQGYLAHTLPVTKQELLLGKVLVSSCWMLILTLSLYLSLFLMGASLISAFLPEGYSLTAFWRELRWNEIIYRIGYELDMDVLRWLFSAFFMSLVTPFTSVCTLFGAISIGQLFSKHRVLMAVLCYIGIIFAENMIGAVVQSMAAMSLVSGYGGYMGMRMNSSFVISLVTAVILYFVSWYINEKKLNLE